MLSERYNQPLGKINQGATLAEAYDLAQSHCKGCKIPSPIVCVERCDVWRVKNEILEIRQIISQEGHRVRLLNAIKNPRPLKILEALYEHPRHIEELQRYLKEKGFYHSRSTIIFAYLKPLIQAGLVREHGGRYTSTMYGRKIH